MSKFIKNMLKAYLPQPIVEKIKNYCQLRHKWKRCNISFSQQGEDIIVKSLIDRLNIQPKNLLWLDIGAHHPKYISNTAGFYKQGYRGINIDANPELIKMFIKHRPKDINLNVLISDKSEINQKFYIMEDPTLSTMSEDKFKLWEQQGDRLKKIIQIKAMRVDDVIEKYNSGNFPDILFIDVEGYELEILKIFSFKNYPKIICAETTGHSNLINQFEQMINGDVSKFCISKGYEIISQNILNTFYVHKDCLSYACP